MMVPIAVSRKTGAIASWIACVIATMWASAGGTAVAKPGNDDRQHAHHDDAEDDRGEVSLDPRDVAEEEAGIGERSDPGDGADRVVEAVFARLHLGHAGDERDVRAHDRDEARDHDRLAAMALVEGVRTFEMLRVEPARAAVGEEVLAEPAPDRVIDAVAAECGEREDDEEEMHVEPLARRRDGTGHEEERIAGKERRHHESRLREDDREKDAVDPD